MSNYQFLSSTQGGTQKRGARGARGLKLVTRGSGTTRIATRSAAMPRCLLQGYLAGIGIILSHHTGTEGHGPIWIVRNGDA